MMSINKIFKIKNANNNEIIKYKSAGVCFYNNSKKLKIMLLKKNNNKWEFLGGKINKNDINLFHTAIREGVEESNGCITGLNNNFNEDIKNIVKLNENKPIYWYSFKDYNYALFFIKISDNMILSSEKYGDHEILENHNRTIHWLDLEDINKLLEDKSNLNFEIDSMILSKINDIVEYPQKQDYLNKWIINKKSYNYFYNLG